MQKEYLFKNVLKEIKTNIKNLDDCSFNEEYTLISLAINKSKEKLFTENKLSESEYKKVLKVLKRRMNGEPLNKIFKKSDFFYDEFFINKNVLAPRKETEILVEWVLKYIEKLNDKEGIEILDLCCGSGAIGLELAKNSKKNIKVTLSDISTKALYVARINRKKLQVESNTRITKSDIFKDLKTENLFDIIVSNPPYIKTSEIEKLSSGVKLFDPIVALDGGNDGLYFYRTIANDSRKYLKEKGVVVCEIGYDQGISVKEIFNKYDFEVEILKDYDKNDRVIIAKLK